MLNVEHVPDILVISYIVVISDI